MPKELEDLVELPENLINCWRWFIDLNNTRSAGMGFSTITYSEIHAYFTLLQIDVEPWEIEVIKAFDRVAFKVASEQQAKREREKNKKSK